MSHVSILLIHKLCTARSESLAGCCSGCFKVLEYSALREIYRRDVKRHLPYGIIHCYLPPDTNERPPQFQPDRPLLNLPTLDRWKTQLTFVVGYKPI